MLFYYMNKFLLQFLLRIKKICYLCIRKKQSGCSAVGSALRSGRRGRAFESPHPDKKSDR